MAKILLVIEDYTELISFESLLKRVGFDVLSLNRESAAADSMLGFPADLVICTFKGRTTDGARLAQKIRRPGTALPKVAVIVSGAQTAMAAAVAGDAKTRIDAVIDSGSEPEARLEIVARLLLLEPQNLIEKYERLTRSRGGGAEDPDDLIILKTETVHEGGPSSARVAHEPRARVMGDVPGAEADTGRSREARQDRYAKALAAIADEPVTGTVPHRALSAASRELQKQSAAEAPELEKIDAEKKEFVVALMKAAKGED